MKNFKIVIRVLVGFASTVGLASQADAVFCEAECGKVVRVDYGGPFTAVIVPEYRSCGSAYGTGPSKGEAFEDMENRCKQKHCILHDGFDVYTPNYIRLNVNVVPSVVCNQ